MPRRNTNLLYEALGQPERWQYPVGHSMLVFSLPSLADDILCWLDDLPGPDARQITAP